MEQLNMPTSEARKGIRIMLVDDNPEFLESASRFLSGESRIQIVGRALSGLEAIERLRQARPHLVLMDLGMPDMNGLEVTRRIKAQPNAPCVIVLTLHDSTQHRAEARMAGADGYVSKADTGEELLPLIYKLFPGSGNATSGKTDE